MQGQFILSDGLSRLIMSLFKKKYRLIRPVFYFLQEDFLRSALSSIVYRNVLNHET